MNTIQHILEKISKNTKSFFNRVIEGRQRKANLIIAEMLQRSEYKNESVYYILRMIEEGRVGELRK
jgi:hypothetical protein